MPKGEQCACWNETKGRDTRKFHGCVSNEDDDFVDNKVDTSLLPLRCIIAALNVEKQELTSVLIS